MEYVKLSLDYSAICTNYNTTYLDRDNTDPDTTACMDKVLGFVKEFVKEIMAQFNYMIYRGNCLQELEISEVVSKRFLFFSLEKEITLQNYSFQTKPFEYLNEEQWLEKNENGILLLNEEEGESLMIYVEKGSRIHKWIIDNYKNNFE